MNGMARNGIAFCGGGSAGHIIPNFALIEKLSPKYPVLYLGTGGMEKELCKQNHIPFSEFSAPKLARGKVWCNLAIPFKLCKSVKEATKILERERPRVLFCKGGYVSIPAAYAAHKLGIPVVTHESDLTPGIANKLIARKCRWVLTAFPETAAKFKNGKYVGTPLRASLFSRSKVMAREHFGLDMRPTVLVFGGGSGSQKINQSLLECLPGLCREYNILHICGKGNFHGVTLYGYKQVEFVGDMGLAYACADYAVARCGANAAFELTALKIPTLYIPLENNQTRGDQVENADYFLKQGWCHVLPERELAPQTLRKAIYTLLSDQGLKARLKEAHISSATQAIADIICETGELKE
jgi:UDP-N-acetylglucosamine--N-acetylmuramyl-(pentapeptide) pyrophosphoryl-undecaprenol N-acetylglucosamine transferase